MTNNPMRKERKAAEKEQSHANQVPKSSVVVIPPPAPPSDVHKKSFFGGWFNNSGTVVAILSFILAAVLACYFFIDRNKPPQKRHQDSDIFQDSLTPDNLDTNVLRVRPILPQYTILKETPILMDTFRSNQLPKVNGILLDQATLEISAVIVSGGLIFYITHPKVLEQGIEIKYPVNLPQIPLSPNTEQSSLRLLVKDKKLYVSAIFRDLETGQKIGDLEFNHWELFNGTFLDFHNTDKKLEVVDKQGNIVFSINFAPHNTPDPIVNIAGYFVNLHSVVVLPNIAKSALDTLPYYYISKLDSNWKQETLEKLEDIQTIFPEYNHSPIR